MTQTSAYQEDKPGLMGRKGRAPSPVSVSRETLERVQPVIVQGNPETLPARVVYTLDGNLVSAMPGDLDLPPPEYVTVPYRKGRLANGLTMRADSMARMMARNTEGSKAFRDAYNDHRSPPRLIAARAIRVMHHPRFDGVKAYYRWEMEREQRQRVIPMKTYVIGKLVDESQQADQASARIRSLELLGKSVSLFTDVRRVETFTSDDVTKLKEQLFQRLSDVAQRMRITPSQGDSTVAEHLVHDPVIGDPTYPAPPVNEEGVPSGILIINPSPRSPISSLGPLSVEDPSGWGDIWEAPPLVEKPVSVSSSHKNPMGILDLDPEFL